MTFRPRHVLAAALPAAILLATLAQCGDEPAAHSGGAVPAAAPTMPAPAQPILGERIHVIVSGSMEGRLEPCGCASGQLGGLPRRMVHVQEVRGADLLLEGGDLVHGTTPLDHEKAITAVNVLFGMTTQYDALGVGPRDLLLPLADWGGFLSAYNAPVVASDLETVDTPFQPRAFVEKDVRGTKVRVVSLTMRLPTLPAGAPALPLRLLDPAAGWRRGLLDAPASTMRILLVHDEPQRVRALAKELQPPPDLVVGIDDTHHEPPAQPELVGNVPIVFPGIRGRYLVDVQVGRTASGAALPAYEVVPLRGSETKPDAGQDPAARKVILDHRQWVADQKLRETMADRLPTANGATFVGSTACGSCHVQDHELWKNSKHGRAWQTLVDAETKSARYGWPVTKYPDCVGCHVVGYQQKSGFVSPEATPDLAGVGCEQCHGPGSAHAAAPTVAKMGRVGGAGSTASIVCTQCHDFEQSPDFDYLKRWAIIEHGKQKAQRPKGN